MPNFNLPPLHKPPVFSDWASVKREIEGNPGDVYYALTIDATIFQQVNAYIKVAAFDPDHSHLCGLWACNLRPDGRGEVQPFEGMPPQFNMSSDANFSPPKLGPYEVFIADNAWVDEEKFLHHGQVRSDRISGLGNYMAQHTQIGLKFQGYVLELVPDFAVRADAIRYDVYRKIGHSAYYNPDAALQRRASALSLGAVMTDEVETNYAGTRYISQGFAFAILSTIQGQYDNTDFFVVPWGNSGQ